MTYQPACLFARLLRCEKGYIARLCAPFRALQANENPAHPGLSFSGNRLSDGSAVRILIAILAFTFAIDGTAAGQLEKNGGAIYLTGMLPDGTALVARGLGDVPLRGEIAACIRCHRPSGYGSSEGDIQTAAVAAPILFNKLVPRRDRLLRSLYQERYGELAQTRAKTPRSRPAYRDARDILNAVRNGIDPAGQTLSPLMPRYDLGIDQAAALEAYLGTLGARPAPGVGREEMAFATIVGSDIDEARRDTLLRVMQAYVDLHNHEVEREKARPNYSPLYKSELLAARRTWRLGIWQLPEKRSDWTGFLQEKYAAEPVFAILGGIANGSWRPIQDFCESAQLPCLFPQTDWPGLQAGLYTLYLSQGLAAEVTMAERWLSTNKPQRVLQVVGGTWNARHAAEMLSQRLINSDISLESVSLTDACRKECGQEFDSAVLWLDAGEAMSFPASADGISLPARVFASGGLLAGDDRRISPELLSHLPAQVRVAWRYAMPGKEPPRLYRLRAWLAARRIPADQETTALLAYLAMDAVQNALVHAVDRFSPEYLIELIEHEIENAQNPGVFPRLSLGPGQRFAAQGARLVSIENLVNPGAKRLSEVLPRGLDGSR